MATGDAVKFLNLGAVTTSSFALLGGKYGVVWPTIAFPFAPAPEKFGVLAV
jgi:hypothetical protein